MRTNNHKQYTHTLLASILCAGASQVHAAGDIDATSGYATIQPNAGNTGYVYTFSWVAPDTNNTRNGDDGPGAVATYTDTRFVNPAGNGNANLDSINTRGGNYVGPVSAAHPTGYLVKYAWAMGQPDDNTQPANIAGTIGFGEPLNSDIGFTTGTSATPKFDNIGNFTTMNSYYIGAGEQGVTGTYGAAPDGSDALAAGAPGAIHSGIGFGVDTDGANDATGSDDFGPIISGFDAVLDTTPTNTMPNTGFVRVEVPFGTLGDDFTTRFIPGTFTGNGAVEVVVTTSPEGTYNAKLAIAGDLDGDRDIDNSDIIAAAGGFAGTATTGKFYADGDMNADGDVDNSDIIAIAGAFTGAAAGSIVDTAAPNLIYDPVTGNITLDADGGANITGFQLESSGEFVDGNYVSQSGGAYGGLFEDISGNVLADSDLTFSGLASMDLGNVLATGLTLTELEALLSTADYGAGLGTSGEFDLIVSIPEPSTVGLLGLCAFGLLRRRRM